MMRGMDLKTEILNELDGLEARVKGLRGAESAPKKETELEVQILRKQVGKLSESGRAAAAKIDGALGILRALK